MNTAEDWFGGAHIALDECHMMFASHLVDIAHSTERAVLRRQVGIGHTLYEFLGATTILYKRLDGYADEVMLLGKLK